MRSAKELQDLFAYHPRGWLVRKKQTARCTFVGQIVKGTSRSGLRAYLTMRVPGGVMYMHRVVFAVVHGHLPRMIDHINRNQADNRIENLRVTNHKTNNYNSKVRSGNTSGIRGISWRPHANAWVLRLMIRGQERHLGYFKNKTAAIAAQRKAVKQLHGEFAAK